MTQQRFRRGEIWTVDLEPVVGSEQGKARPALIIQNGIGNLCSPVLIVAALTSGGCYLALPGLTGWPTKPKDSNHLPASLRRFYPANYYRG